MTDKSELYVVRHEHGFVKLGKSVNPEQRLQRLQCACPYELHLETTISCINDVENVGDDWAPETVEGAIHQLLGQYAHYNEWYDVPDEIIDDLRNMDQLRLSELWSMFADFWPISPSENRDITAGLRDVWIANGEYEVTL